MPEIVAEYIDRLLTLEMRPGGAGTNVPRGSAHRLYQAAREAQGGSPLTLLAGRTLQKAVGKGDTVLLATGISIANYHPVGETDGPPAVAALARTLDLALGGKPVILTEPSNTPVVAATVEAAGLPVLPRESWQQRDGAAMVIPFPTGPDTREQAAAILDELKPKALICIEKLGPNERGEFHTTRGMKLNAMVLAHIHYIVERAREMAIPTIGIGDVGNEIGFGLIRAAVQEIQPAGRVMGTATATDVLVSAAISNWGSYGVAAMLAYLRGDEQCLHDEATEERMIDACVRAGATDGLTARRTLTVDGTDLATQRAIITLLHQILKNGLRQFSRPF